MRWLGLIGLSMVVAAAWPNTADARNVALVIGNAAYTHAPALTTPDNDGRTVASTLRGLGFEVLEGIDADRARMEDLVRDFTDALRGAEVGLFYFSGLGFQANGENFLLPIDARPANPEELAAQAVNLTTVLGQMGRDPRTNLAFLDASREDPLLRLPDTPNAAAPAAFVRGLAKVIGGLETLIGCAAQPGAVVPEETGATSRFTAALLNYIASPGLDVRELVARARQRVIDESGGQQVPWVSSSLTRGFAFVPPEPEQAGAAPAAPSAGATATPPAGGPEATRAGAAAPPPVPTPPADAAELLFWQTIQNSSNPADFAAYLQRYPSGLFAELARNRLNRLEAGADPAAAEAAQSLTDTQRREIQRALTALGFNTLGIDGVFGPNTRAAITRFQQARQMVPAGYLTRDQARSLLDATRQVQR